MMDDAELLRRFADEHVEDAFTELVHRHIDFVHAAALRQCHGDRTLAQDVAQVVFADLARHAARVSRHPVLVGWLHTATRYTATTMVRGEIRRRAREEQVAAMSANSRDDHDAARDWERLQPVLDAVLGELKERDRAAILLRFFEGKSLREVGLGLRLTESAARSCVDRALDQMQVRLARRGVTSTSAALGLTLANQTTIAAPAALATSITSHVLAGFTSGAAGVAHLLLMKKIIIAAASILVVAELSTATVALQTRRELIAMRDSFLHRADDAALTAVARVVPESGPGSAPVPADTIDAASNELVRLRQRIAQLKSRPPGVVDSAMADATNAGRETPQQASETLAWATRNGDARLIEAFIAFTDDTSGNRAAFMAGFSEATQARYRTPEELFVAVNFNESFRDPPVAQQILEEKRFASGIQTVTAWTRYASGREARTTLPFQESPDGWTLTAVSLVGEKNPGNWLRSRIDPATGTVLPLKK